MTCSTCEILGLNSVNHYLDLFSFVEISKNKNCKNEWIRKITCQTQWKVRILLDALKNSPCFYSGGDAYKQEAVNLKTPSTKHDITLYVCRYLFFPL